MGGRVAVQQDGFESTALGLAAHQPVAGRVSVQHLDTVYLGGGKNLGQPMPCPDTVGGLAKAS